MLGFVGTWRDVGVGLVGRGLELRDLDAGVVPVLPEGTNSATGDGEAGAGVVIITAKGLQPTSLENLSRIL